jgi:Asp-tRNA(Asn)/Glu-tRNA(Gln) amidotransferase A subunit family amidase
MSKDVRDCALVMDVLAGSDKIDDRVPLMVQPGFVNFIQGIDEVLAAPQASSLKGKRTGILRRDFHTRKWIQEWGGSTKILSAYKWGQFGRKTIVGKNFYVN